MTGWNTLAVLNRDVWPVRFSNDGNTVTLLDYPDGEPGEQVSGTLRFLKWDWRSGELTQTGEVPVEDVIAGEIIPGPGDQDKQFVAIGHPQGDFSIVDERDFSTIRLENAILPIDWAPSGRSFAARRQGAKTADRAYLEFDASDSTGIWDTSDWTIARELESAGGWYFFADDRHLLSSAWEISAGFNYWDIERDPSPTVRDAGVARIRAGDVFPDGKMLATGGSGSVLEFWNVETGRQLLSLELDEEPTDVSFSPRGAFLMVKGRNFFTDTDEMPIELFKAMSMEAIEAELNAQAAGSQAK